LKNEANCTGEIAEGGTLVILMKQQVEMHSISLLFSAVPAVKKQSQLTGAIGWSRVELLSVLKNKANSGGKKEGIP
jgi:hypothetical protein